MTHGEFASATLAAPAADSLGLTVPGTETASLAAPETSLTFAQRHLQAPYLAALGVRDAVYNAVDYVGDKLGEAMDRARDIATSLPKPNACTLGYLAGVAVVAPGGVAMAEASVKKARASQVLSPATFNVFTHTSPDIILNAAQQSQSDQSQLNILGGAVINTLPGHRVDFKQRTLSVEAISPEAARINYVCPNPLSPLAPTSTQRLEIFSGNRAAITPCPSNELVTESSINLQDPIVAVALAKYKTDPFRSGEDWIGNTWDNNVFFDCPDQTQNQNPRPLFKYNRKQGTVKIGFDGVSGGHYCDLVGQYSEKISILARNGKGRKFKQIGGSALHIDGLPEVLVGSYGLAQKHIRHSVTLTTVGDLCRGSKSNARQRQLRVQIVSVFKANQNQKFQRQAGQSAGIRNAQTIKKSLPRSICK